MADDVDVDEEVEEEVEWEEGKREVNEEVIVSRDKEDRGDIDEDLSLDGGRGSVTDSGFGEGNGGNDANIMGENVVVCITIIGLVERLVSVGGMVSRKISFRLTSNFSTSFHSFYSFSTQVFSFCLIFG